MFCTNCGKPKNSNEQSCQYCGTVYDTGIQSNPLDEINNEYDTADILPKEQTEIVNQAEKPKIKKHKKSPVKKVIAIVVLTFALVFIGGSAYIVLNFVASYRAAAPYFSLIFNGDLSAAQKIWAAQEYQAELDYQAAKEDEAEPEYSSEPDGDSGSDIEAASVGKAESDGAKASINADVPDRMKALVDETASDAAGKTKREMALTSAPSAPYYEKPSTPKEKTPEKQKDDPDNNRAKSYEYVKEMNYTLDAKPSPYEGYYEGITINGLPHGYGTFIYLDSHGEKCQYEGEFVEGCFEGYGEKKWDNGAAFEGVYKNNLLNGFGKRFLKGHKLQYEGMYVDGKCQGDGKLYSNDKIVFEGAFTGGIPDEQLYKAACAALTYDDLQRLPENYEQTPVVITGKIIQIVAEKDGQVDLRLATSKGRNDIMYITYDRKDGEGRILKGDEVRFWGQSWGIISPGRDSSGRYDHPGLMAYYVSVELPE